MLERVRMEGMAPAVVPALDPGRRGDAISLPMRPSLPIVEQVAAPIGEDERRELAGLAARLRAEEPLLAATEPFGPGVGCGLAGGPGLFFEDHRELALLAGTPATFEYRARLLAGDGDLVVIGDQRCVPFEDYCRDLLRLGEVEVLRPLPAPEPRQPPLATRCLRDPACREQLIATARRHGSLSLVPYMGTGSAWALAAAIAAGSGAPVRVATPPPRLTRRVNDKLWFAERVAEVLGRRALPPSYYAFGPAALAGHVRALCRRSERVVIKVPDSAGSAGNVVLRSADLAGLPPAALRQRLVAFLAALGWHDVYPLMVGVWECPVLGSPSVQLWIPGCCQGSPVIEGIFAQVVQGPAAEFVGAVPCALPPRCQARLAGEAVRLACLLQGLGYFGRCSFDAVLVGNDLETAEPRWVECNGRWGGVSIPMTLANRLTGDGRRRSFAVVQRARLTGPKRAFAAVLAQLEGRLFRPGATERGVVILTPGGLVEGTGLHVMILADSPAAARVEAEEVAALFLGGDVGGGSRAAAGQEP